MIAFTGSGSKRDQDTNQEAALQTDTTSSHDAHGDSAALPDGDRALANALDLIDRFVERIMPTHGMPGLALAITDRDGLLATRNYGYADLAALTPVDDETFFQHGSIGKTFTAICLLQLAEEGVVDLHAPVTDYLPWFALRSASAPITIHHLLSHTAGIIEGTDFAIDSWYEVWALRNADSRPPGGRAHYSNVGYKALGFLLEAVTGKPYAKVVQERILDPLAMTQSASVITHNLRRRLAVGHVPFYDDRPWRPAHGLVPATWLETNTGDGSTSGAAADLAAFLRMLLNGGLGPNGRLLSPESFALMLAPHPEMDPEAPYGYGIAAFENDGRQQIGHSGDMVGFVSDMFGDVDSGIGVAVLINGMADAELVSDFALRTIISARAGEPLPELPPDLPEIETADFAGIYHGETRDLTIDVEEGWLTLLAGSERIPLEPTRSPPIPDAFVADHPDFNRFPLRFGRDAVGGVVELFHGGDWYTTDSYEGTRVFDAPTEWVAYPGHYRGYNPWTSNFRIVIRKGELLQISPNGSEQSLTPDGDAFRIGDDPDSPERIAFDTLVAGKTLRARLSGGADYYRFFTP